MNKVKFYLMTLIMGAMSLSVVNAARVPLTYDDPTDPFQNPHRNPIEVPEVDLDVHTLTFYTSCFSNTLRLVNDEDEVVYTTIITSDTLILPSTLEGEYEIQIIQGQWYFYGWIEL